MLYVQPWCSTIIIFDQLPQDQKLAHKIVQEQAEDAKRERDVGYLGRFLGSKEYAATYVASIVAIIFAIAIAALLFFPTADKAEKLQELQIMSGLFLGVVGFIFGSKTTGGK